MFRGLTKAIFAHAHLKVAALAIAVAIYIYANSQLKEEVFIPVPLTFRVPEGCRVVHQSAARVHVRFRGPQRMLKRRRDEAAQDYLKMTATLAAEDFQGGKARLRVDPRWLDVPEHELVQTSVSVRRPVHVEVYVSEIVEKSLPVEVITSGKPHAGYEIRQTRTAPAVVSVKGPAVVLDDLERIRTQRVPVWDLRADLRLPGESLVLEESIVLEEDLRVGVSFEADPSQVAVYIEVGAEKEQRKVDGIVVHILKPPDFPYDLEIPPEEETVSVVVSGLPDELARLEPTAIRAYVDVSGLEQESITEDGTPFKQQVHLLLPETPDLSAQQPEPAQVTVILRKPQR